MNRTEFEHTIRAAGAILGVDEVLVIGSQAVHASIDYMFPEAERSIEVDIASLDADAELKADLIDGSIGELSLFQSTFGYYAQGVTPATAILPDGWRSRLVSYASPSTNGVTALCLELHDLWISKMIANRAKDHEFCAALFQRNLVNADVLIERLHAVTESSAERKAVILERINAMAKPI